MKDTAKLMQLLSDIDNMEDFIKVSFDKISVQTAEELLRLISEMKTRALA